MTAYFFVKLFRFELFILCSIVSAEKYIKLFYLFCFLYIFDTQRYLFILELVTKLMQANASQCKQAS